MRPNHYLYPRSPCRPSCDPALTHTVLSIWNPRDTKALLQHPSIAICRSHQHQIFQFLVPTMECAMASTSSVQPVATHIAAVSQKTSLRYSQEAAHFNIRLRRDCLKLNIQRVGRPGLRKSRGIIRLMVARASGDGEESTPPIAPFQPESPTGQFLAQLLQSHPHLVPAAVEQELEKLAENRSSDDASSQPSSKGSELVLYRRIAELKEQERQRALEEIIYTLIVQKFVESGISMVPNLASITSNEKPWQIQIKELEAVHTREVSDLIAQHMILVLGGQGGTEYLDLNTLAQISKIRVGQVYAASIIYGYFLRRIFQRFQLEKSMKMLPPGLEENLTEDAVNAHKEVDSGSRQQQMAAAMGVLKGLGGAGPGPIPISGPKPTMLQSYIMSIDGEMLQKMATVRSPESLRVLEKHTEALFGRPEIFVSPDGSMRVNNDEVLKISLAGLKHLVLEAVAFGSFLWEVECHVDASYAFV